MRHSVQSARNAVAWRKSAARHRDAMALQCGGKRLCPPLAAVARAINLPDLCHRSRGLAAGFIENPPGEQRRLEQHAPREIYGIEILIGFDRHFNVGKETRYGLLLAELVDRRPVLAAESRQHGKHRLLRQIAPQLFMPRRRRSVQLPHMQLPTAIDHEHHLTRRAQRRCPPTPKPLPSISVLFYPTSHPPPL